MAEIDLIAGTATLGKLVEQYEAVRGDLPITNLYKSGEEEEVEAMDYIWQKRKRPRTLAGVSSVSGQSYVGKEPDNDYIHSRLIHITIKEKLTPERLFLRSGPGEYLRSNASNVIVKTAERILSQLYMTTEAIGARQLQDVGGVAINAANTLFPTGAVGMNYNLTIDGGLQNVAAGAAWDLPATKILSADAQLSDFISLLEANGHAAGKFLCQREIVKAIVGNTEAQAWLTANGGITVEHFKRAVNAAARMQGQDGVDAGEMSVFSGLGGIPEWHVMHHGFENRAGTFTRYLDPDKAILLPPDLTDVLCFIEGPSFIPEGNLVGDVTEAADMVAMKKGVQLFAMREHDETGAIWIIGRRSFLPLVKSELGVLQLNSLTT